MNNIITLELEGDRITADKFKKAVIAFYGLVDEVSSAVTGKKKSVDWIVSVKQGSIILQSEAEPKKEVEKIVASLGNGLESLEESQEQPEYFNDRALNHARVLSSVSDPKDSEFSRVKITTNGTPRDVTLHSAANIDSIQGYKTKGLGAVEGKLWTISGYGGLKIVVYEAITNSAAYYRDQIAKEHHPDAKRIVENSMKPKTLSGVSQASSLSEASRYEHMSDA
ncbi:MAG: hypothetical protein IID12_07860, partial [Candidatus Marinimicrobia bacterium]|nr:hypothetical protein [Candidatus Neomarinimicrobiota bacterium]